MNDKNLVIDFEEWERLSANTRHLINIQEKEIEELKSDKDYLLKLLRKTISRYDKCPECGDKSTYHMANCKLGTIIFDDNLKNINIIK